MNMVRYHLDWSRLEVVQLVFNGVPILVTILQADVIIWDYEARCLHARLVLHKVKVEDLAFSPNDSFLVSLGGQDDGSVVVWNVARKEAICGSPAQVESAGVTHCVAFANNDEFLFVTGGK